MRLIPLAVSAAILGAALLGCATQKPSLYERLGGQPAITAVVDDFVANVAADARINRFFANTEPVKFKKLLVEQICAGTGGPCTYTGRSMLEAHKGMNIRDEHFAALVEDLVTTLKKFNVPQAEQTELLGILGPMKAQIVSA